MQLTLWELQGECRACGREFLVHRLSDFVYGDWLLHFPDERPAAIIHLLGNPVIEDLEEIINEVAGKHLNRYLLGDILVDTVGLICDPIDGEELHVVELPICPFCRSPDTDDREFLPPRSLSISLPFATHSRWNSLSKGQRRVVIERQITRPGRPYEL